VARGGGWGVRGGVGGGAGGGGGPPVVAVPPPPLPEPPRVRPGVQGPPRLTGQVRDEPLGQPLPGAAVGPGPGRARPLPPGGPVGVEPGDRGPHDGSAPSTWPRNSHRVTSGVEIRSYQIPPTAVRAWATRSAD